MESIHLSGFSTLANSLYKKGETFTEISMQLRLNGAPENVLEDIIGQLKKIHFSKKRNSGFLCCGIGVALIVAGCLLALLLYSSGNIRFAMYGLTSVGVLLTLKGLADLMGW